MRTWILSLALLFGLGTGLHLPPQAAAQTSTERGLPAETHLSMGELARKYAPSIFQVGYARNHGTAWVLSRQHRLLATNAHVADILNESGGNMIAIASGSRQVYKVARVWYHPGVERRPENERRIAIRSTDPRLGSVQPSCPDVAVLQLAPGGPGLPPELPLAARSAFEDMFAQPVAMLGFPGHDSKGPVPGTKPQATFHQGTISRLSDFRLDTSRPDNEMQFVQHTIQDWGGFSGSPIFGKDGRVLALHNMVRFASNGTEKRAIPHGVRVDCLWELLVHHRLTDKVSCAIEADKLNLSRWLGKDPRTAVYLQARAKIQEAWRLYRQDDFQGTLNACDEALRILPDYGQAYWCRSSLYLHWWFEKRRQQSDAQNLQLLKNALAAAQEFSNRSNDVEADSNLCVVFNNLSAQTNDPKFARESLTVLDRLLARKGRPCARGRTGSPARPSPWTTSGTSPRPASSTPRPCPWTPTIPIPGAIGPTSGGRGRIGPVRRTRPSPIPTTPAIVC